MSTFLHSLWAWARKMDVPATIAPVAPLQAETQADQALNVRLIQSNNAFVTRDYGWGPVLVHYDSTVADLAAHEMAKLAGNKPNPVKFRRHGSPDPAAREMSNLANQLELFPDHDCV